jgi:glycosyltransferase involved in cell wall biosynthesis
VAPNVHLRPTQFGPVAAGSKGRLLRSAVLSLLPGIRDFLALVRYVRRNEIDVIHCEKGPRNGFYAYVLTRLTPARYAMHFHWKYGSYLSALSRLSIKKADAIISVSSWTGRGIRDAGVQAKRIFPVLNGIDASAWDPEATDGEGVRAEFGVPRDSVLVVMVAQLVAWKRQAVLIEAFRRVVRERPGTRLLLVGAEIAPPAGAGSLSYTDELRRLIADEGLQNDVILTGRRSDIREVLSAADIFALPSVDDPCALAHIEAMAMAKPVVTVSAGGAPELVEDRKAGLVGPVDDTDALAQNIIDLIDDPAARRELGEYGRRRVHDYLNAQRMADEVEAVYRLLAIGGLE